MFVLRDFELCLYRLRQKEMAFNRRNRSQAEVTVNLIVIYASVYAVSISTPIQQTNEHHITLSISVWLWLTFMFLISIHHLIWQHVSKLIGLLFGTGFLSRRLM